VFTAYSIDGVAADGFELQKKGTGSVYIDRSKK
jgi:hypothetical protein